MGPTRSTGAEVARQRERQLQDLLDLYGRERRLYGSVLELSRRQGELIRQQADLPAIRELLEHKRHYLDQVNDLESVQAEALAYWQHRRTLLSGPLVVQLQQALQEVGDVIEQILQLEAENDHLFLQQAVGETP